jgi:hypothetical protein
MQFLLKVQTQYTVIHFNKLKNYGKMVKKLELLEHMQ